MKKNGLLTAFALIRNGYKKALLILLAVAIVAGSAAFAMQVLNKEPEEYTLSRNVFLDNISVNGIDVGGMGYNDALDTIVMQSRQAQSSWSLDIICNGFTYSTISYGTIGISVDYAAIESALQEAWKFGHTGSVKNYEKDVALLAQTPYSVSVGLTEGNSDQLDYILNIIAENVYQPAKDAEIIAFDAGNAENPFTISTEINGRSINADTAKTEILQRAAAGEGGSYVIALQPVAPSVTAEKLSKSVSLLATGKNAIDKYSTKERNENIALAFSKINGMILENGDTFSFNKIVGNRTLETGYKPALGYISGEMVEVIGGGVCQASTTLYSAALCAGLTIKERTPHSMPVSYIELGQDATVNYMRGHMIDLKFKNETGYPVYITAAIEENATGRLMSVVRIFGHELEDDIHYRVESVETELLPIPEEAVVRVDKEGKYVKYADQTYHYSKGSEGHVVETYLQKMRGSTVIEQKLISKDTYKAQPKIDYIGAQERTKD